MSYHRHYYHCLDRYKKYHKYHKAPTLYLPHSVHEIFGQNIVMIDFQIVITRTGSTQGESTQQQYMVKTFLII